MSEKYRLPLFALMVAVAACGSSCLPRNLNNSTPPAPTAFYGVPTLEDVLRVVNTNTQRVQRLQTSGATLESGDFPDLRADLAVEPPRRLRLRAGTPLTGPVLDLGSNDERFWVWAKPQRPPAVYYASHQQAESGALRGVLPVSPGWLMEAIGLIYLDPQARHEGPFSRGAGQLEIRSSGGSRTGDATRVTVIDSTYGWVLQQHLLDHQGRLLASSIMSRHQYDPVHAVSLPRCVDINLRPAELAFRLQIDNLVINQPPADGNQEAKWTMPTMAGVDYIDLGDPRLVPPGGAAFLLPPTDATFPTPRQALAPLGQRYRGFSGVR
jgi:hypothetical protein